ncbi:MAG: AMP-dependent synthetase, partial [Candidatus Dormibacteraeota bacterium]|nr:AMP-dependent synthetase [Candidatus Dormibacteraeota bacterium]
MTATATSPYAWVPSPEQIRASRIRGFVDSLGLADLEEVQRFAIADPERFWTAVADDIGLEWSSRFTQAIDTSPGIEWTRFWVGGRLNLAALAVDRWAQRTPDKEAIVWEGDDGAVRRWSYAELHG